MIRHKVKILIIPSNSLFKELVIGQELEILGSFKWLNSYKEDYLLSEKSRKLLHIPIHINPLLIPKYCCSLPEKYEVLTKKKKKESKQKFTYEEVQELTKFAFELGQGSILGPDEVNESELYYTYDFKFILENL